MNQEWLWAAVIIAAPFVIFAALEVYSLLRRRRYAAIARRSKDLARPPVGSRPDRAS